MSRERDRSTLAARYFAVQKPVLEEAEGCFSDQEIQDLRCIVRLAVEFDDYLKRAEIDALDSEELDYVAGSVFAGIESFTSAAHGYRILVGATPSTIDWPVIAAFTSPRALKEKYLAMYGAFEALDVKTQFEDKLRVLLDLFKLQLVFVSILYRW